MAIASAYVGKFTFSSRHSGETVYRDSLYEFLYERNYEAWFCNLARSFFGVRNLRNWFLGIHTGEAFVKATESWSWDQRQKLGQRYLFELSRDYLRWFHGEKATDYHNQNCAHHATVLERKLELDGYAFRDGDLLRQEVDILNVEQERGILQNLFRTTKLSREAEAFEFLRLSEEHFVAERWSDCISNARKFFELVLQEGAKALASVKGEKLADTLISRPVEVRQYLERSGLFEKKEREALDKLYGLLSETGAHPYMAASDQARLLRHLSLTLSQFALLRLAAAMAAAPAPAE